MCIRDRPRVFVRHATTDVDIDGSAYQLGMIKHRGLYFYGYDSVDWTQRVEFAGVDIAGSDNDGRCKLTLTCPWSGVP